MTSARMEAAVRAVREKLKPRDQGGLFGVKKQAFTASEAIAVLVASGVCAGVSEALDVLNRLEIAGFFVPEGPQKMLIEDQSLWRFGSVERLEWVSLTLDFESLEEVPFDQVDEVVKRWRSSLSVIDRSHWGKTYSQVFVGSEGVSALIAGKIARNEWDALRIGNLLLKSGVFHHVTFDHSFKNEYLFYRFLEDEDEKEQSSSAKTMSWASFLGLGGTDEAENFQSNIKSLLSGDQASKISEADVKSELERLEVFPLDEHNARLLDCTHPKVWKNPAPKPNYNVVVIGGGTAGLVTAAASAGLGATVALIEKNLLGGDCLNVGCVPSKALLRSAKVAHCVKNSSEYGIDVGDFTVNFEKVMERLRRLRADIAPHDSADRFSRELGVDVFYGTGSFVSPNEIVVEGQILRFSKAVICSGGTAAIPKIPGIDKVPYLTNANVFNLTTLPPRIIILGSGPIGCELAQAFCRLGSQVFLINRTDRILGREDSDASEIIKANFKKEGVNMLLGYTMDKVSKVKDGSPFPEIVLTISGAKGTIDIVADCLLVATGRKPNIADLGLNKAGVNHNENGIIVDDYLRTSKKHIFAAGDCCSEFKFTHVADFMARIVIRNALFFGSDKFSNLLIPWVTYTDPEVAHVGLYPRDLLERGIAFDTFTKKLEDNDRAIVDGVTAGFIRIHVKKGSDIILGATIVGEHAGDIISEISVAMKNKISLGKIATVIHPYPTLAESIRQAGDLFNKTRLTPFVKGLFRKIMAAQL